MHDARYSDILDLLRRHDTESNSALDGLSDPDELRRELKSYFEPRESTRAVLGVDIYQYSRYDAERQRLVPVLFKYLYGEAIRRSAAQEAAILANDPFARGFISTGDGGFQIAETPLQALVLCVQLQMGISAFNAGLSFPRLRRLLGPLTVRYAITYDSVMKLDDNYFGSAIISNARILSRDTLNRFLLDQSTAGWFLENLAGVENLPMVRPEEVIRALNLPPATNLGERSLFRQRSPAEMTRGEVGFRTVIVQKIGTLAAKQTLLDVYSCYFQVVAWRSVATPAGVERRQTIVTVGNLNSTGLT